MKSVLAVYTAIFGNYDNLIEPKEKFSGCDFICFTDQEDLKSNVWKIVVVKEKDLSPLLLNRKYKIMTHIYLPEYQRSLYVDGNIYIKKNPLELAEKYLSISNIAIPRHFKRNCVYEEVKEIIKYRKADVNAVISQINYYKSEGFPKNYGLTENNIIFRNHNKDDVIRLMSLWWEQIVKFPTRDQISFMYCVFKTGIKISLMEENARGGDFFEIRLHRYEYESGILGMFHNIFLRYLHNYPNCLIVEIIKKLRKRFFRHKSRQLF